MFLPLSTETHFILNIISENHSKSYCTVFCLLNHSTLNISAISCWLKFHNYVHQSLDYVVTTQESHTKWYQKTLFHWLVGFPFYKLWIFAAWLGMSSCYCPLKLYFLSRHTEIKLFFMCYRLGTMQSCWFIPGVWTMKQIWPLEVIFP